MFLLSLCHVKIKTKLALISYEDSYVYTNGKKEIKLFENSGNIIIVISSETSQEEVETTETTIDGTVFYKISDPDGYSNLRDAPNGNVIQKVYATEEFEVIGTDRKHKKVKLSDGTIGFIVCSQIKMNFFAQNLREISANLVKNFDTVFF